MLNSVGANKVLDNKSHMHVKTAPRKKHAGIIYFGFELLISFLTRCGTAMPTNETGPANAVTQADHRLERITSFILNEFILTPTLFA